jgi:hypothetical protein
MTVDLADADSMNRMAGGLWLQLMSGLQRELKKSNGTPGNSLGG